MTVDPNGGNPEKLRQVMARLKADERRFVDYVLRGYPHETAAEMARFKSRLAAQDLLGRPRVAEALQRAASYLPPDKAVAALRPLLTAKLISTALSGGAAGISAGRDLRAMADAAKESPDALRAWDEAQARRRLVKPEPVGVAEPEVGITALPKGLPEMDS